MGLAKLRSIEAKILGMKTGSSGDMVATDHMSTEDILVLPEDTLVLPEDHLVLLEVIKDMITLGQLLISINLGVVRGLHTAVLSSMVLNRSTVKSPLAGRVRSRSQQEPIDTVLYKIIL